MEQNVILDQWHKCKIDKKLYRELIKRSDFHGIKHVSLWMLLLILSGYVVVVTWLTWWTIPALFVYGNIFMGCNPVWHECGHRTAFKTRWLNEIFYHIGSFMFNFEPIRWRWSHFHHHTYTLHTEKHYDHEIQVTKPTDLLFVFLHHLPLGNLAFYKSYAALHFETIKHALGITTVVLTDCVPKEVHTKVRFAARIHILLWVIIISSSIYFQTWLPIVLLLLPFIYGTTLRNMFDFVQHAGLANNAKDHRLCTRTVKLNPIFSFLYWGMEYHIEHHMFPMVPSYNLKKLHEAVKGQMPKPKNGLWDTYKEIIPAIFKQTKDPTYVLKVNLPKEENN
jgi:fatty acid desaturase